MGKLAAALCLCVLAIGCGGGSSSNTSPVPTSISCSNLQTGSPCGLSNGVTLHGSGSTGQILVTVYDQFGHEVSTSGATVSSNNTPVVGICNTQGANPVTIVLCASAPGDATLVASDAPATQLEIPVVVLTQ
jgi:hypothetical protein